MTTLYAVSPRSNLGGESEAAPGDLLLITDGDNAELLRLAPSSEKEAGSIRLEGISHQNAD
jgi:hypothetical protein